MLMKRQITHQFEDVYKEVPNVHQVKRQSIIRSRTLESSLTTSITNETVSNEPNNNQASRRYKFYDDQKDSMSQPLETIKTSQTSETLDLSYLVGLRASRLKMIKFTLWFLLLIIFVLDIARLVVSINCDKDPETQQVCIYKMKKYWTDPSVVPKMWYISDALNFVVCLLPALVFLPSMHLSMKRLKNIDFESYNNSKCKIYLGSFIFLTFVVIHLVLFKIYRFEDVFAYKQFNKIIFLLFLTEAMLMLLVTHMVISTTFQEEEDDSVAVRNSDKDKEYQKSLFVNQNEVNMDKTNKRLDIISEHTEVAEDSKEE